DSQELGARRRQERERHASEPLSPAARKSAFGVHHHAPSTRRPAPVPESVAVALSSRPPGGRASPGREDSTSTTPPTSSAPPPTKTQVAVLAYCRAESRMSLPCAVQAFASSTRHCESDC